MLKSTSNVTWGSDPEGFFQRNGQIIGSERLIPEKGLLAGLGSKVVRDGVQFEFNPEPSMFISHLGRNISTMFQLIAETLKNNPDTTLCFDGLVEVSREELNSLSPATRVLGCQPSENFYGPKPINVDAATYRKRSSGGHIHIGLTYPIFTPYNQLTDKRTRLVPLMDIFVGNTAVLLDRDPGAAERRENYGRAGEYRLQKHGLEYRTLSNFWLRSYTLMSLMFGMASIAVSVLNETLNNNNLEIKLVEIVDIQKVVKAINTNDYKLALENFHTIRPFLDSVLPPAGFPLNPKNINQFLSFADNVQRNGIEKYFPTENIVSNWCENKQEEFADFLKRV